MRRNPYLALMWVTAAGAVIVSNVVDDTLVTLWGLAARAPWLVSLGLVIGWAKASSR